MEDLSKYIFYYNLHLLSQFVHITIQSYVVL